MGSHEQVAMALESQAVSVWVTKLIVSLFSKICNKYHYHMFHICKQANACWKICRLQIFSKIKNFQKNLSGIPLERKILWIQIRADI